MVNFHDWYVPLKTYLEEQLGKDNFEVLPFSEETDKTSSSFSANVFNVNVHFYIDNDRIAITYMNNGLSREQKIGVWQLIKQICCYPEFVGQNLSFCLQCKRKNGVRSLCFSCGETQLQYFMTTPCFGYTDVKIVSDGNVACRALSTLSVPVKKALPIIKIHDDILGLFELYFDNYSEKECRPSVTFHNGVVAVEIIGEEEIVRAVQEKIAKHLEENFSESYKSEVTEHYDESSKLHLTMDLRA